VGKTVIKAFQVVAALAVSGMHIPAKAENAASPIDYFMISRGDDGLFIGSHKIFMREAEGLKLVKYCGRSYWIRPVTVAWTQIEVENDHEVRVEFNRGKGWRPICERPTDYVTLADLGVTLEPRLVVRSNGDEVLRVNRFHAVSESFRSGVNN
jgi:hypothetical protein